MYKFSSIKGMGKGIPEVSAGAKALKNWGQGTS